MAAASKAFATGFITLLLMLPSASLFAYSETLSFRRTPSGTIEAVVSGYNDGPFCETEFVPPTSISISGTTISIESPYTAYFCGLPFTPSRYSVTADLGALTGGPYQVTWTEGPLSVSGTLVPDSLVPISIPTLSTFALTVLALVLVAVALCFNRRLSRDEIEQAYLDAG
jgi:hypothetical protein